MSDSKTWKTLTVRQGRHDFRPTPWPWPLSSRSFEGMFILDSSCWYDSLGVDNQDWNKLVGLFHFWDFRKNKNSLMIAWRPRMDSKGYFEVCLYENINGRNVPHEDSITIVPAGIPIPYYLHNWLGKYTLFLSDVQVAKQQNAIEYGTVGLISGWFGGNRSAPHDMTMRLSNQKQPDEPNSN